jgi:hypothetical protein
VLLVVVKVPWMLLHTTCGTAPDTQHGMMHQQQQQQLHKTTLHLV